MHRSRSERRRAGKRRPLALVAALAIAAATLTAAGTSVAFADDQPTNPTTTASPTGTATPTDTASPTGTTTPTDPTTPAPTGTSTPAPTDPATPAPTPTDPTTPTDPATTAPPVTSSPVTISDPALALCADASLKLPTSTTTFDSASLASITSLSCTSVSDLTQLSSFTGLTHLSLTNGTISNVSPIAGLRGLTSLVLDGNRVTDLRPLSALTATISAHNEVVSSTSTRTVGMPFALPAVYGVDGKQVAATAVHATLDSAKANVTPTATTGSVSWGTTGSAFTVGYSFVAGLGSLSVPTPAIVGTPTTFRLLAAVSGATKPAGAKLSYQWYRDGSPIAKATSSTYTLGIYDTRHTITVRTTGVLAQYKTATSALSAPKTIAAAAFTYASTPVLHGSAATGGTLSLQSGTWAPSGISLHFQWNRNGRAISGQTRSTYTLTPSDVHQSITATVTGTKTGFATLAHTSRAVVPSLGTITGAPAPTISGSTRAPSILTANPGRWPSGVNVSTQWRRNGVNIAGATGHTFALSSSYAGSSISVVTTGSKSGYKSLARVSAGHTITKAAPPAAACTRGTYVNSSGHTVCRPEAAPSPPAGATAQCNDGVYSFSEHRSGTCSGHGGVKRWL